MIYIYLFLFFIIKYINIKYLVNNKEIIIVNLILLNKKKKKKKK